MNARVIENVIHFGYELFFLNDDDDDERLEKIAEIENFAEEIVPNFADHQFKQHFRMSPTTFEDFLRKLHAVSFQDVTVGHPKLLLEKQAMMCIWYLANLESFRSVSNRFGVSKSTAWDVLARMGQLILRVNRVFKIISWPSQPKALKIINAFQNINGFPGVLGCIDGSHIRILPPKENHNSYINRKKFHSILLQGVCDDEKLFIDVFAGLPGSCHDARLFEISDLHERINNNSVEFPNDSHVIGDLAYTLTKSLIVGFKNFGNLTNRQRNFNNKLSQLRVKIEHAFALLKGRFRRLKYMETVRLDLICMFVIDACILHNLTILNGDSPDDVMNVREEIDEERRNGVLEDAEMNVERNRGVAFEKRNFIMNILHMQ